MTLVRSPFLVLALTCAGLAAGATLAAEQGSKPKRVCIDRREIRSIRPLDDKHALLGRSAGRYSLLTTDDKCRGLGLARSVAFQGPEARVCGDGSSLLSFEYPAVGPMRCRVERIEPVDDETAARELIASRARRE